MLCEYSTPDSASAARDAQPTRWCGISVWKTFWRRSQRICPVASSRQTTCSCHLAGVSGSERRIVQTMPFTTTGVARPPNAPFQSRFSPSGDQELGNCVSGDTPVEAGPLHEGQSAAVATSAVANVNNAKRGIETLRDCMCRGPLVILPSRLDGLAAGEGYFGAQAHGALQA